ncbi:MAG: TIGR04255 family protein [Phocaeicola plebeius]
MDFSAFKSIPYKQYRNTFLQNIFVTLHFEPSSSDEDLFRRFDDYTQMFFQTDGSKDILHDGAVLTKKDGSLSFVFTKDMVQFTFDGSKYINYVDSILPQLSKIQRYVKKVILRDNIKEITIRKINSWYFQEAKNKPINYNDIQNIIFNKQLQEALSTEQLTEEEKSIPEFKKAIWKESDSTIEIRTAFISIPGKKDFYRLILDSEYSYKPINTLRLEEVEPQCKAMNKKMFDVFHWCVTPKVIELMDKIGK